MSVTHQFWTDSKKIMDFLFFPLGLSNFWLGAWFPFDKEGGEEKSLWGREAGVGEGRAQWGQS